MKTGLIVPSLVLALAVASVVHAREVEVPLQLDHALLRQALLTQIYRDPGNTAQVWNDGVGCNFLTLSEPRVDSQAGRLRVISAGKARVGTAVGQSCLVILDWTGTVEVFEEPSVDAAQPVVRFRVVDSNLYGPDGKKQLTGKVWDWVKQYVHPRLETMTIDLGLAVNELRALLPLVLSREDAARTQAIIDSLSLAEVRCVETGLTAILRFSLPDIRLTEEVLPERPAPEPTLSPEELQRWEAAWQQWDAFLTFVTKLAARDATAEELRRTLFDVLVESRHELIEALAPTKPGGPDPVRPLFIKAWRRLAPVLRRVSAGLPGEVTLRYLSFIAAADALRTIDELGPDLGLDISADGLRRLARIIAPTAAEDPVAYSLDVDPELRQLFGFGPPLPPPEDNPAVDLSAWFATPVWAAIEPDPALVSRLNRWVPTSDEIDAYLPLVRDLLRTTSDATLSTSKLDADFHQVYRWLVLATAWQESCWRQFVRQGNTVKPIESPVGSVGLMQVNQKVWRGFYDLQGLRKDISYNARAGSEIVVHYLNDYAVARKEHTKTGNIDNLARATYAVYNGGPGHLSRYRKPKVKPALRKIDDAFWSKYQAVKLGNELAVAQCFGR